MPTPGCTLKDVARLRGVNYQRYPIVQYVFIIGSDPSILEYPQLPNLPAKPQQQSHWQWQPPTAWRLHSLVQ